MGEAATKTRSQEDTEAMVYEMVWPIWKEFLASDYTLTTLAKAIGTSRRRLRNIMLYPGAYSIGLWGEIHYFLSGGKSRINFELYPAEEHSERLFSRLTGRVLKDTPNG